jgi:hypothetical protein
MSPADSAATDDSDANFRRHDHRPPSKHSALHQILRHRPNFVDGEALAKSSAPNEFGTQKPATN